MLQSPSVLEETPRKEIMAVSEYLEGFRAHGFNSAKIDAREIAEKILVEVSWPEVRQRKTKKGS